MVSCSSRTRHALCGYVAGAGTCALVASLWYARQRLKRFGESRSPKEAVEEACYVPAAISRYRREAAVAVELARECGRAMLAAARSAKSVEWKGAGILDRRAQAIGARALSPAARRARSYELWWRRCALRIP